jgi:hypothetical protein
MHLCELEPHNPINVSGKHESEHDERYKNNWIYISLPSFVFLKKDLWKIPL